MSYGIALAAAAAAIVARYLLDPWMGNTLPLVTLFGAVAAAVWVGGARPAIASALLGYVACNVLFMEPRGELRYHSSDLVGFVAYLSTCALIILIGEAARIARARVNSHRELLRVTLRSIGDAVITTDNAGRVTYLNAVAEALTGWTHQDAVGQPLDAVFQIVNELTREPVDNPATRALREGIVVGLANHTVLIQKPGGERAIDDSAAPIRDERGRVSGCVLVFRDVAARRQFDQERARQLNAARMLAAIVESSDDAIISKSLEGVIQSWNASAERLFGYTADQAVGRHISLIIPPDRIAEEDAIISSLRAGRRVEHYETERVRSDGGRIQVSLTISPIKNDAGVVVGASKIARDITDRKRAEDDLKRLADTLSEGDRRKNEFLATLAHELRNPLAPISNAVKALQLGGADTASLRAAADMLGRQVAQMARLVDDLLDMSRITRGKIELRKERVELAPIISQAVEAVRPMYRGMSHELTVALPARPVYLEADPARLAQVVGNLLNNACKFTDRGGHVWLTVETSGEQATMTVRDNGIGIAAADLPGVFDMFAQVNTSRERSRDGLGIGLTLVKTLVEMHGGSVDAQSDGPGHGSQFVLRMPMLAETPNATPRPAPTPVETGRTRRVLIVDDNEDGAESMALVLEIAGHHAHKAYDGVQAIEAAERLRPDCVLLDIGLPRLNGYEVCKRIRQEPWGKYLTIVALTGWGQEEDRNLSREAGFDAHMVKPVDHDFLLEFLASLPASHAPLRA